MAGNDLQQQGGVADVVGEGADLVEGTGKGHQAVARYPAVGRLQADDAAQAGRLANGAAGVGAQRQRRLAGRHGRCRAAAGTAGDALEIPRIARHLKGTVLGGRAHRELVHVGLAEQHGVGLPQALDDVSVVGRHDSCRRILLAQVVGWPRVQRTSLMARGRPAEQTERLAALALPIERTGLFEGASLIDVEESPHLGIALADRLKERRSQRLGGDRRGSEVAGAARRQIVRS